MIFRIIKVELSAMNQNRRLRLITLTKTLIISDITKTECVVPENIHTPTTEGIGNSEGVGGGGSKTQEIPEGRGAIGRSILFPDALRFNTNSSINLGVQKSFLTS